jgi:hypothetical protein
VVYPICPKRKNPASLLIDAIERAGNGQIDANLGGGVIKQRIARPGEGKSKGYRSIIIFRKEDKAFFVFGFSKSEQDNIHGDEEEQFKKNGQASAGPHGHSDQ